MGDWNGFRVSMDEVKNEYLLLLGIDNGFISHRTLSLIPGITLSVKWNCDFVIFLTSDFQNPG
jgi:hypothetical protein